MDEITSSSSNEVAVEWMLSCTGGATNALVLSQCLASPMFVFGMASSSIGLVRFQRTNQANFGSHSRPPTLSK